MPPAGLVLLLITIALPLVELALLIKAAQVIGFWLLLTIILSTAMVGFWILQLQGLSGMRRLSEAVRSGKAPLESMMYTTLLSFAAFCLIAPGLITDTLGLLLLLPPVRSLAARAVHDWMTGMSAAPAPPRPDDVRRPEPEPGGTHRPRGKTSEPPIIEGEFERIDERPLDPRAKGGGKSQ